MKKNKKKWQVGDEEKCGREGKETKEVKQEVQKKKIVYGKKKETKNKANKQNQ